MVLFGHCYPLSGNHHDFLARYGLSLGHVAVDIFFITSGFLVTRSLIVRQNLLFFTIARVLRIFPALIVAVLFSVFVIGFALTSLNPVEYLKHPKVYEYLFNNTTLILKPLSYELPSVFQNNPFKNSINGSLWTLPWEIKMYILLASLGSFVFLKPRIFCLKTFKWIITGIVIISLPLYSVNYVLHFSSMPLLNVGGQFVSTFFMGAVLYVFQNHLFLSKRMFFACVSLLIYFADNSIVFFTIYNLVLGYIVIYLAYIPDGNIRKFNLLGDYSYGIYIYAFPIQQIVASKIPNISISNMFVYSFFVTIILAIFSWHCVEKPILMLRGKLVRKRVPEGVVNSCPVDNIGKKL